MKLNKSIFLPAILVLSSVGFSLLAQDEQRSAEEQAYVSTMKEIFSARIVGPSEIPLSDQATLNLPEGLHPHMCDQGGWDLEVLGP